MIGTRTVTDGGEGGEHVVEADQLEAWNEMAQISSDIVVHDLFCSAGGIAFANPWRIRKQP